MPPAFSVPTPPPEKAVSSTHPRPLDNCGGGLVGVPLAPPPTGIRARAFGSRNQFPRRAPPPPGPGISRNMDVAPGAGALCGNFEFFFFFSGWLSTPPDSTASAAVFVSVPSANRFALISSPSDACFFFSAPPPTRSRNPPPSAPIRMPARAGFGPPPPRIQANGPFCWLVFFCFFALCGKVGNFLLSPHPGPPMNAPFLKRPRGLWWGGPVFEFAVRPRPFCNASPVLAPRIGPLPSRMIPPRDERSTNADKIPRYPPRRFPGPEAPRFKQPAKMCLVAKGSPPRPLL